LAKSSSSSSSSSGLLSPCRGGNFGTSETSFMKYYFEGKHTYATFALNYFQFGKSETFLKDNYLQTY